MPSRRWPRARGCRRERRDGAGASELGTRNAIPEIIVGGLILAGVTSLPNAVAAVYLAARGRGAATLSTAMNSNALNVAFGLLLPATVVGLGTASGQIDADRGLVPRLTAIALAGAYISRGLRRGQGALIIAAYATFAGMVVATAYSSAVGMLLSLAYPRWSRSRSHSRCARRGTGVAPVVGDHSTGSDREATAPITPAFYPAAPPQRQPTNRPAPDLLSTDRSSTAGRLNSLVSGPRDQLADRSNRRDARAPRHSDRALDRGAVLRTPHRPLGTNRDRWRMGSRLAVLLGLPDGIWGTSTHLVYLTAVVIVAVISTSSAAVLERHRWPVTDR